MTFRIIVDAARHAHLTIPTRKNIIHGICGLSGSQDLIDILWGTLVGVVGRTGTAGVA
jgi:hypothetical protein